MLSIKNQEALDKWISAMHFYRSTMYAALVAAFIALAWLIANDGFVVDIMCTIAIIFASYVIGIARGKWLEAKLIVHSLHQKPNPPEKHPE